MKITEHQFSLAVRGDALELPGGEKARYVVADVVRQRAKYWGDQGRPDKAARLYGVAGYIETGRVPSKKTLGKIEKDLAWVRSELVF